MRPQSRDASGSHSFASGAIMARVQPGGLDPAGERGSEVESPIAWVLRVDSARRRDYARHIQMKGGPDVVIRHAFRYAHYALAALAAVGFGSHMQ